MFKSVFTSLKNQTLKAVNKIKDEVQSVIDESRRLQEEEQQKEQREKNALLPWQGLRALSSTQNGQSTFQIKEEILALSQDASNFTIDDDSYMYEFNFKIDEYVPVAVKMLEEDPKLNAMRIKLVPARVSDERFWKNYFYNVEVIKMRYRMANRIEGNERQHQAVQMAPSGGAQQRQVVAPQEKAVSSDQKQGAPGNALSAQQQSAGTGSALSAGAAQDISKQSVALGDESEKFLKSATPVFRLDSVQQGARSNGNDEREEDEDDDDDDSNTHSAIQVKKGAKQHNFLEQDDDL